MMRAITDPELQQDERDVASSLMLLYLVGGLAMGAILSFVSATSPAFRMIRTDFGDLACDVRRC